jgi:preprotein translocase subunit SecB
MPKMQIRNIIITSVDFSLNNDFKPDEKVDFSFNVSLSSGDQQESKLVDSLVVVNTPEKEDAGNLPFHFSVTGRGIFSFSKELTEKEIDLFKNINCPAIVFPYIREQVADLTRRSGFPPLHLPPVNFVKMHKEDSKKDEIKT